MLSVRLFCCPFCFCCGWLACCAVLAFCPLVFGASGATPATKRCYLRCFVAFAFPGWLAGCSFWAAVSGTSGARARDPMSAQPSRLGPGWGPAGAQKAGIPGIIRGRRPRNIYIYTYIKGPDNHTCYVFPKCPHTCTVRPLYGCDYRAPRCTECSACHDFGNGIAKVLRLPRFRNGIAKVLRLPRFRTPPAARATTSCPSRQLPNATPATQTHTQMHRMLRLPRLRQRHRQSAAPATISQRHRQSAAPATISHTPRRARDNILSL